MHHTAAAPIRIDPGFSFWLACYLLIAHLSALFLVIALKLETLLLFALMVLIVISLLYYWRRILLYKGNNVITAVAWGSKRGWQLQQNGSGTMSATLSPASFVSRHIVILHFRLSGLGRRTVIIAGDSVAQDQFRRLRILLNMYHHFGE